MAATEGVENHSELLMSAVWNSKANPKFAFRVFIQVATPNHILANTFTTIDAHHLLKIEVSFRSHS